MMDYIWAFFWIAITVCVLAIVYFALWEDNDKWDDWKD